MADKLRNRTLFNYFCRESVNLVFSEEFKKPIDQRGHIRDLVCRLFIVKESVYLVEFKFFQFVQTFFFHFFIIFEVIFILGQIANPQAFFQFPEKMFIEIYHSLSLYHLLILLNGQNPWASFNFIGFIIDSIIHQIIFILAWLEWRNTFANLIQAHLTVSDHQDSNPSVFSVCEILRNFFFRVQEIISDLYFLHDCTFQYKNRNKYLLLPQIQKEKKVIPLKKKKIIKFVHIFRQYQGYNIITMMNVNEMLYHEVKGKWNSLYPIYFDKTKTVKEGRKIPKELCVEQPNLQQLTRAVCQCKLRNIIEPQKAYSRDYFQMGRLKVQVFEENEKPVHNHIPNKNELLKKVAEQLRLIRQK